MKMTVFFSRRQFVQFIIVIVNQLQMSDGLMDNGDQADGIYLAFMENEKLGVQKGSVHMVMPGVGLIGL